MIASWHRTDMIDHDCFRIYVGSNSSVLHFLQIKHVVYFLWLPLYLFDLDPFKCSLLIATCRFDPTPICSLFLHFCGSHSSCLLRELSHRSQTHIFDQGREHNFCPQNTSTNINKSMGTYPQNMAKHMVLTYLHFRILKISH